MGSFETLLQIRVETKSLLAETAGERYSIRLRRIIVLLGYMAEHLEMLSGPEQTNAPRVENYAEN